MATDVVMPQMGESIAEGTIVRWIKQVGETVERDEPLFEISTDKVDAEIPAPAAGVVTEIRAKEGRTAAVNTVVAVIAASGEAGARKPAPQADGAGAAAAGRAAEPAAAGQGQPSRPKAQAPQEQPRAAAPSRAQEGAEPVQAP